MKTDHASSSLSRRQFIGQASCAALGTSGLLSSLLTMGAVSRVAAAQEEEDYKALVCLFLAGGNDSFNMLIPWEATQYDKYKERRGGLYLGEEGLALKLAADNEQTQKHGKAKRIISHETFGPNLDYGLHAALPGLQARFNDSPSQASVAFVANVGTKISNSTSLTSHLPLGLFSHNDQIEQWQTCVSDKRSALGWAGRMVDTLWPNDGSINAFYNISLSGINVLQSGRTVTPYSISPDGVVRWPTHDGSGGAFQALLAQEADNMMNGLYRNIFAKTYARTMRGARDHAQELLDGTPLQPVPEGPNASAKYSRLRRDLMMVARMIRKQRAEGNIHRQTYFVRVGGWDHHDEVILNQNSLFETVDEALTAFWEELTGDPAISHPDLRNEVTLFSASDFGRTLSSNGNGSDHGWGGNQFVMGGAVQGGTVYGSYPDMTNLAGIQTDERGRLLPSVSVEQYLYPLLLWFGVSPSDMDHIFHDFHGRFGMGANLEFMKGVDYTSA